MFVLLLAQALATPSVVTVGTDLVAGAPVREASRANAWVPVLADCLEEAGGAPPVVDRSSAALTTATLARDVEAIRALAPAAVVISVGSHEQVGGDMGAFHDQVEQVVRHLRGTDGPKVYLVGLLPRTVEQEPLALRKADQTAVDAALTPWNEGLARIAGADDGVWFVDLWASWPSDPAERGRMTVDAFELTDPAHARIGAVICEQILANLRNRPGRDLGR